MIELIADSIVFRNSIKHNSNYRNFEPDVLPISFAAYFGFSSSVQTVIFIIFAKTKQIKAASL